MPKVWEQRDVCGGVEGKMNKQQINEFLAKMRGWHLHFYMDKDDYCTDCGRDAWNPYENIAQAMECVEVMRKAGYSVELGDNHHVAQWYCCFEKLMYEEFWGYGKTPAAAICEGIVKDSQPDAEPTS